MIDIKKIIVNLYQDKRTGYWFYSYTDKIDGKNKQIRKSTGCKSKIQKNPSKEADLFRQKLENELNARVLGYEQEKKILFSDYRKQYESSLDEKTLRKFDRISKSFVKSNKLFLKRLSENLITNPFMDEITEELLRHHFSLRAKTLKLSSYNREIIALKSFFKTALKDKYIKINPMANIEFIKPPKNNVVRTLGKWEILRLLDETLKPNSNSITNIANDKIRLFILIGLFTGYRKSEILNLRWSKIDFDKGETILDEQKNRNTDLTVINQMLLKALKQFKEKYCKNDYVFGGIKDNTKAFNRISKEAGLKIGTHILRKTCNSMLLNNDVGGAITKTIMRHTDNSVTFKNYYEPDYRKIRNIIEKLTIWYNLPEKYFEFK